MLHHPIFRLSRYSPRQRVTAALVSMVLHAAALVWLMLGPLHETTRRPLPETTIEVVFVPPEPAKPAPPKVEEKAQDEAPPDPRGLPPPPPPQLTEAPIAEVSRPPPGPPKARPGEAPPSPQVGAGAQALVAPPAERGELSRGGGARPGARPPSGYSGPPTQDEKDFILSQILPFWLIDYRNPRFARIVFGGRFTLGADGMLLPPFGKNDPWEPTQMVKGYDQLLAREREAERTAIESFLNAVRAAQPFRLPPGVDPRAFPREIPVYFRLGDL
jgi:hypothetical protein